MALDSLKISLVQKGNPWVKIAGLEGVVSKNRGVVSIPNKVQYFTEQGEFGDTLGLGFGRKYTIEGDRNGDYSLIPLPHTRTYN